MHMIEIKKRIKEKLLFFIVATLGLLAVVVAAVFYSQYKKNIDTDLVVDESGQKVARAPLTESGVKFDYVFDCRDDKSFSTSYDLGSNALTLTVSPEQSYVLPQDVSETGAYYTSVDRQVTFYENGGSARVEINGEVAYENCEATPAENAG